MDMYPYASAAIALRCEQLRARFARLVLYNRLADPAMLYRIAEGCTWRSLRGR